MCKFANQVDNYKTSWQYRGVFYGGNVCFGIISQCVFYSFVLCSDYRNIFSGDMVPVIFGRMDVAVYFIRIREIRRH